jgi:hypothetical protein
MRLACRNRPLIDDETNPVACLVNHQNLPMEVEQRVKRRLTAGHGCQYLILISADQLDPPRNSPSPKGKARIPECPMIGPVTTPQDPAPPSPGRHALICGVSGQDGAYLARLLLGKGYEVTGTSRDATVASRSGLEALGVAAQVRVVSMAPNDSCSVLLIARHGVRLTGPFRGSSARRR